MRSIFFLAIFFVSSSCSSSTIDINKYHNKIDSIFVNKQGKYMKLFSKKVFIKSYIISIGQNEKGHKQYKGDNRTPEGLYTINDRNPNSAYYLNLGISYPNAKDKRNASKLGKSAGGDIKIHGYADANGNTHYPFLRFAYTWGCIALNNKDMAEVYKLVKTGAKIFIE